jgi:hypothetical protein
LLRLEATQGSNLETLKMKMKMKPSINETTISGINDYIKPGGKLE